MGKLAVLMMVTWGIGVAVATSGWASQTVYPTKDGTIGDGVAGPFDGVADDADWTFNQSSYEGSITLTTETPQTSVEHRLVWEYDLRYVTLGPWVSATLTFQLRGAPIWPFPDTDVHVYSYPADLVESLGDFSAGPAAFQGAVTVAPFQVPTIYMLDVSDVVSIALVSSTDKVAFRLQIDPETTNDRNQAFIDALDTDATTKPYLTINSAPRPGDYDGDGDVDLADYTVFADCMGGPGMSPAPSKPGVTVAACLEHFDRDDDADVDLRDFGSFQYYFAIVQP